MPSQKASSKKVYITQESPRRSNESFKSQSSSSTASSTAYGYGSYGTRFETRYESPTSRNMGSSEYSSSTSSMRDSPLRVPDHPTRETMSKKSRGKVDVFLHEQRWEDKSEPRSWEATTSDYKNSKSSSKSSSKRHH